MSQLRKNSVRDKVIVKKWIYLEREIFYCISVVYLIRMCSSKTVISQKLHSQYLYGMEALRICSRILVHRYLLHYTVARITKS